MNNKEFSMFDIVFVTTMLLIVILFCITPQCIIINTNPGTGQKIGQIVKLTKEGIFSKTWEGQLIRGGLNGGNGSFGTVPFNFTIETDSMASKANNYLTNQTEVVVKYRIEGISSICRSGSGHGYYLTDIEPK